MENTIYCRNCNKSIDFDSKFCKFCGAKVAPARGKKRRGNGTGSVVKISKNNYKVIVTLGYKECPQPDGKIKLLPVRRTKSNFTSKTEALLYIEQLKTERRVESYTFKQVYDKWAPTQTCLQKTKNGYDSAFKYFHDLWYVPIADITIDDLEDCFEDCEKGRRTKQLMKTVAGLVFKYSIPRGYLPHNLNLVQYVKINDDSARPNKPAFTVQQLELFKKHFNDIPFTQLMFVACYTGFRPSEFIALDARDYNRTEQCFVGGGKTAAGTNRTVTVSPKILNIVERYAAGKQQGPIFTRTDGKPYSYKGFVSDFYTTLEALGIENPTREVDGKLIHTITPHCCRHTFATLMKRTPGADKDKLALIGHTSDEMLRYYEDVSYEDLRKITDNI